MNNMQRQQKTTCHTCCRGWPPCLPFGNSDNAHSLTSSDCATPYLGTGWHRSSGAWPWCIYSLATVAGRFLIFCISPNEPNFHCADVGLRYLVRPRGINPDYVRPNEPNCRKCYKRELLGTIIQFTNRIYVLQSKKWNGCQVHRVQLSNPTNLSSTVMK